MRRSASACFALVSGLAPLAAVAGPAPTYETLRLTDAFYGEGATIGDFDKDGHADVISGPFLYYGPTFVNRSELYPPVSYDPHGYSNSFLQFASDVNGDGWLDLVDVGFPGKETLWYANPAGKRSPLVGNTRGHWDKHVALAVTDNESPGWADVTGDGKPELIAQTDGRFGYATPDPADATKPWTFHPISDKTDRGRFTHGLGVGDVNGDGRADFVENNGWWEQPADLSGDPEWNFHPQKFADAGAQIVVADMNGDKKNDVVSARHAHGYGLDWFEQKPDGSFEKYEIMGGRDAKNPGAVTFAQLHAVAVADMDGDGRPDIVTGKRFWAHGPTGDVEPDAPPVLYYFRNVADGPQVRFEPVLMDDASGVGTQLTVGDLNGDGKPDVAVGSKYGTFVTLAK